MTILSKSLKALAMILGLILSVGSVLIGLDAQTLATSGITLVDQNQETAGDTVYLHVTIQISDRGYFFDLYDVNVTLLVFDDNGHVYSVDNEIKEHIGVGESWTVSLTLTLPLSVLEQKEAGAIHLYTKLYFIFWFGKYNYRLLKFGTGGVTEI